ncbi:MAG: dipeptidase [Firmicutes bacterium]|nr:dipeptidase [Bacillota bacterium]
MKFIDLHCDTLMNTYLSGKEGLYETDGMVDFRRMKEAGQMAQFFAIWMLSPDMRQWGGDYKEISDEDYISRLTRTLKENLEKHEGIIALARNAPEMLANEKAGRMSAFLAIEDGRSVLGDLANIDKYYEMGVRLITLTWNHENSLGWPNYKNDDYMAKGLKPFGVEAVRHMNGIGMLVDVSHLSDAGFYDVARAAERPFVASHSNCRAICPHMRNLTDDMIRLLADKGGVMGVNFAPAFIGPDVETKKTTVEMICAHLKHMMNVGGEDVAALGSDFDGISGELEVSDPTRMELIFERLSKEGVPSSAIEKVAWKNAARVITESLK